MNSARESGPTKAAPRTSDSTPKLEDQSTTPEGRDGADACFLCGQPAELITPTGHPACQSCKAKYPDKTQLADLLEHVETWLLEYVVFPNDQGSVAMTLWIACTHIADQLDVAPYLLTTSAEIESGKTRAMEIAATLSHNPLFSSSMTPAVLFRTIDRDHPTLFLDEADNIWTGRRDDKAAELVALLNAGHRRGVKAHRMGGANKTQLLEFDVFGPKAIAGAFPDVGKIPEALRSRSIHLRMHRKLPEEKVSRWTRQTRERHKGFVDDLRTRLAETLKKLDVTGVSIDPLDELSDRDFDVWEPLLVVARLAGGRWPTAAQDAAISLCSPDPTQSIPLRIQMLRDLRELWEGTDAFMFTKEILDRLHEMPERNWGDFYGSPLTAHKLGRYLGAYGTESKFESGEGRRKGYYRQDLEGLWARYVSETSQTSQTSQTGPSFGEDESIESIESIATGSSDDDVPPENTSTEPLTDDDDERDVLTVAEDNIRAAFSGSVIVDEDEDQ